MEATPSQKEREEVRLYCCERPLERPDTNIKTAVAATLLFLISAAGIMLVANLIIYWLGFRFLSEWFRSHQIEVEIITCVTSIIVCFLVMLKRIVIGVVKLYQHYAPENIRRKCILKPTCSEYMILAVEKYGVLHGIKKGIYRLMFTCRGWDYRIDDP